MNRFVLADNPIRDLGGSIMKKKQGGKREGAGRPVTNPTKVLTVRVPIDRYDELKEKVKALVKGPHPASP